MKASRFLALLVLFPLLALHAETRVFTDNAGRTLKAEFVGAEGDVVTLKREDGTLVTAKAGTFSPPDIAYLKEHGLQYTPPVTSPAVTTSTMNKSFLEILTGLRWDLPKEENLKLLRAKKGIEFTPEPGGRFAIRGAEVLGHSISKWKVEFGADKLQSLEFSMPVQGDEAKMADTVKREFDRLLGPHKSESYNQRSHGHVVLWQTSKGGASDRGEEVSMDWFVKRRVLHFVVR